MSGRRLRQGEPAALPADLEPKAAQYLAWCLASVALLVLAGAPYWFGERARRTPWRGDIGRAGAVGVTNP